MRKADSSRTEPGTTWTAGGSGASPRRPVHASGRRRPRPRPYWPTPAGSRTVAVIRSGCRGQVHGVPEPAVPPQHSRSSPPPTRRASARSPGPDPTPGGSGRRRRGRELVGRAVEHRGRPSGTLVLDRQHPLQLPTCFHARSDWRGAVDPALATRFSWDPVQASSVSSGAQLEQLVRQQQSAGRRPRVAWRGPSRFSTLRRRSCGLHLALEDRHGVRSSWLASSTNWRSV